MKAKPTKKEKSNSSGVVAVVATTTTMDSMRSVLNGIPVDPDAKLSRDAKSLFMSKLKDLRASNLKLSRERKKENERQMLEAYRTEVKFDEKLAAVQAAKHQLINALNQLADTGLDVDGSLAVVYDHDYIGEERVTKIVGPQDHIFLGSVTSSKKPCVERFLGKKDALSGAAAAILEFDELELRMAMATTIREAVAIINVAAGGTVIALQSPGIEVVPQ